MCFLLWSLVSCMWVLRQTPSTYMYNFYNHIWCSWTVSAQCAVFCMWVRLRQTRSGDKRGRFDWLVIADSPLHTCCPGTFSRNFFIFVLFKKNTAQGEDFTFTICVILVKFSSCFFSVSNNLQAEGQHYLCGGDGTVYKQSYRQSRGENTQERHKEETFESTK